MRKLFSIIAAILFAGSMMADNFTLVTSASDLAAGAEIIIVNTAADKALGTTQNTNNRAAVAVTESAGVIEPGSDVQIITLEASGTNWKLNVGDDSYLYAASSSNNYLKTNSAATAGDNGVWAITFGDEGVATIVAQGANTRNVMRYNPNTSGNPMFSCYGSTSTTGTLVKIFKKGGVVPTVAKPSIAPADANFYDQVSVNITCATTGSSVYYTLDGTDPSSASTLFENPIVLTATTTVKAIAYVGTDASQVNEKTFVKAPRYDVAAAVAASLTDGDIIAVRGIVTKMTAKGKNFNNYGSLTLYVADPNGANTEFQFFNCQALNNVKFTATEPAFDPASETVVEFDAATDANGVELALGDTVVGFGPYKLYNTTHELNQGCYLVDIKHPGIVPPVTYNITVNQPAEGGEISADVTEAEEGATITLIATPDAGWQFAEWIVKDADNNDVTVTNDQFTMPASDVTVTATFNLIPVILKYAITVDDAIEGGSVSADKEEAAEGEAVTLTATPDANYVFGAWNVKDADNADVTVTNNQFTMPAKAVTVSAVFQPVAPVGCDWDNLPFFNAGITDTDENYNQFKICKEGEQPNVVNIQTAGWADNHKGIYVSYPSAVFGTINIDAANYTIQGAGILFHLDAFTANETEVSVVCDNVEMVFTVLNTKAITPVVPIEIEITDATLVDDVEDSGFWWVAGANDAYVVSLKNLSAVTALAGDYAAAALDPEYSYVKALNATDSVVFVDGTITVEELAGGVHFSGTMEGADGQFYILSISKALVGPTVVDVVAASPDDYVRWDDQVASDGWWQIYGEGAEFGFSLSNVSTTTAAGTYGIDDLDPLWCYVVDLSNTADTIKFTDGEVVVAIDAAGVVTVTGELLGSDGKTYAFDLTYKDPTAETTVNVTIAEGELDDTYLESDGLFGLAGIDATNNITAQFYIWTDEGIAGDYTEEDLDNYYFGSGIKVGTTVQEIFSATIHITVDDNNEIVLTADVLCYNNTLYKVTLTVPGETPQPTYAVTFAQPQNGTLVVKNEGVAIASGDEFEAGVVLTVEATPADGYILSTLTAGGVDIAEAKRFTIVDAAVEVVATFVADPTGINNVEGNQRRIKAIENGQLFINVNGVRYNVNGARVK